MPAKKAAEKKIPLSKEKKDCKDCKKPCKKKVVAAKKERKEFKCDYARLVPTMRTEQGFSHGYKNPLYVLAWENDKCQIETITGVIREGSYVPRRGDTIILTGKKDNDAPIFYVSRS